MSAATQLEFSFEPERKLSTQMRAVLMILEDHEPLQKQALPYIDLTSESIAWDKIFKNSWSSGERGALLWAYAIWRDEARPRSNAFDLALGMSPGLQAAVLRALALRWGLTS